MFYQRNLPHLQPPEGTFFITYRLFGSIPKKVINSLKAEKEQEVKAIWECIYKKKLILNGQTVENIKVKNKYFKQETYKAAKRYFKKFDDYLDTALNEPHWLKNEELALLNADALKFYEGKHYHLWAYCIMSNHIHVLFTLLKNAPPLDTVMKRLKGYTGKEGNRILDRVNKGRHWVKESYDHLVRLGEFERILWYILNNPLKVNLVSNWQDWTWSYLNEELYGIKPADFQEVLEKDLELNWKLGF